MKISPNIETLIQSLPPVTISASVVQRLVALADLTSLNSDDSNASIAAFLQKADTVFGHVAAVCIYPPFVALASATCKSKHIHVATVVNFPSGNADLSTALVEINNALEDGADEIDIVLPYQRFLANDTDFVRDYIAETKAACGNAAVLKVILETGAYPSLEAIQAATRLAIHAGADFIKTSTGKISQGASLPTAAAILTVIKELQPSIKHAVGFKAAGGIREWDQAVQYVQLAEIIMGKEWVQPKHFRLGVSKLLDNLDAFA